MRSRSADCILPLPSNTTTDDAPDPSTVIFVLAHTRCAGLSVPELTVQLASAAHGFTHRVPRVFVSVAGGRRRRVVMRSLHSRRGADRDPDAGERELEAAHLILEEARPPACARPVPDSPEVLQRE